MDKFDCTHCRGRGLIPYRIIELINPCEFCRGEGKVDWVQNATNTPISKLEREDYHKCVDYNITRLDRELRDLCRELNIHVKISYEKMPEPDYSPRLIYPKRGIKNVPY